MKKTLLVGSALMLLSTSAFATKARLMALGEDKDGSYYISDYRNVYINPSELGSYGNLAVIEWGGAGKDINTAGTGATVDSDTKTKAQGGMIYKLSNGMSVGAILGDETDVAALIRILSSNGGASQSVFLQTADNVVDLFVSGDAGVKWGANLLYTEGSNKADGARYKQNSIATRLGVSSDAWNAHLLVALGAKADAPDYAHTPTYKGKLGFRLGGGYDVNESGKVFGMYESYSWKQKNASTAERVGKFSKMIVGYGHTQKVTDSGSLFIKGQFDLTKVELEAITGLVAAKIDRMSVPLTVGYEHAALSWLTLRGSVVQNIYGTVKDSGLTANLGGATGSVTGAVIRGLANQRYGSSTTGNGGKKTLANSTTVNAGATLKFGSLEVDGLIGATPASRTGAPGDTANTNAGILALDNLETRVGMTYKF
jgi:hypothetical protein